METICSPQGRIPEAVEQYDEAVRIQPNSAVAHNNLAIALVQQGRPDEAIKHYEQALRLKPDYPEAQNGLAWQLAALGPAEGGNPVRAVALAQRACELTGNSDVTCLDTLAVAYAAAGRFNDAITTAREGHRVGSRLPGNRSWLVKSRPGCNCIAADTPIADRPT